MEKISILMGIYNCAPYLGDAIQSIQKQTYSEWELILCDDGSSDDTYKVASQYKALDNRIILMKNDCNMGLNKTLNKCLRQASGKYIARMDGDDVCVPERFQKQIEFLESHSEYDIVSSGMYMFDENGTWGISMSMKSPMPKDVVEKSCICHAPVMMTKKCMDSVGGYTEDISRMRVEDVDLWIKLYAAGYRCYNIQEALYGMRNDQNAYNRRKFKYRINSTRVRLDGCGKLGLGYSSYIKSLRPIIIGLIPAKLRRSIKRARGR